MSSDDPRSDCQQLLQAAPFVLGALEEDESARYREHLQACAACRGEVAGLRPVAQLLPTAVPLTAAPAALRDRIMSVVNSEAELLRAAGAQADRPTAVRRRRWRPVAALGGALAVGLGVAIGALVIGNSGGSSEQRTTVPVAVAHAHAQLRTVGDRSELVMSGLPAPTAGRIYQVWVQRGRGAPAPTDALFGPNLHGDATVDVPGSLRGVRRMMVTSEPQGGSLHPTSTPVLSIALHRT